MVLNASPRPATSSSPSISALSVSSPAAIWSAVAASFLVRWRTFRAVQNAAPKAARRMTGEDHHEEPKPGDVFVRDLQREVDPHVDPFDLFLDGPFQLIEVCLHVRPGGLLGEPFGQDGSDVRSPVFLAEAGVRDEARVVQRRRTRGRVAAEHGFVALVDLLDHPVDLRPDRAALGVELLIDQAVGEI